MKRITGEGLDEEETFLIGIVAEDKEMVHFFFLWKKFSWAFPRKFEQPKQDVFLVGGKVFFADREKAKMN